MSAVIQSSVQGATSSDGRHDSSGAPDCSLSDRSSAEVELFSRRELDQFARDDEEAGRRIGKILAVLFIYTVIAMSVVILWTFQVVQ